MLKIIMAVLHVVGCVCSLASGEPYTGIMTNNSNSRTKKRKK